MKSRTNPLSMPANRLYSLDALRGFDMFWLIGGGAVVVALGKLPGAGWLDGLVLQMKHVPWEGFRFWDLIFPLFMFISGVALPFSVQSKRLKNSTNKQLLVKAVVRMLLLIILGLLYNGVFREGFANARYVSILGQIGIAYFFASLLYIYSDSFKTHLFALLGILSGVAILQLFVPIPGIGAGVLTPEGCINGYFDRMLLPGRLAYGPEGMLSSGNGIYDALGLLCIVSATGITLMGTLAGKILQNEKKSGYKKTGILSLTGIGLIVLALILSPFYPIIKNCWTSTYNLLAGGVSLLLMTLFYLVVDVWKYQRWAFFFMVIGLNSLFIYLVTAVVPVGTIVQSFTGWIVKPAGEEAQLVKSVLNVTGLWLLLYYMYKRKIFIKV